MQIRPLMATAALALAPLLPAQVLPSAPPATTSVLLPFNAPQCHYQQWFSAAQMQSLMVGPSRMNLLVFLAGNRSTITTMLDVQVRVAHSTPFPTGLFDLNFVTPPVTVVPRQMVQLSAAGPGQPCITFNFDNPFLYDGVSPVVIDIQVFGNQAGPGGQSIGFTDEYSAANLAIGSTDRYWNTTSATASAANGSQPGVGLFAFMGFLPGTALEFGQGCPGPGNITPLHTVSGFPRPGFDYTLKVENAPSQVPAALVAGFSRTTWAGLNLPISLGAFNADGSAGIGIGGDNCDLQVAVDFLFFTQTTGAGPGGGVATHVEPIPPISGLIGSSIFTQWVIFDAASPNNTLTVSNGIEGIGGPP